MVVFIRLILFILYFSWSCFDISKFMNNIVKLLIFYSFLFAFCSCLLVFFFIFFFVPLPFLYILFFFVFFRFLFFVFFGVSSFKLEKVLFLFQESLVYSYYEKKKKKKIFF